MKIRFWGTRGSLAKPGPGTVRYGGNTSCVQVESAAGTLIVIDCGTGAHALGQRLLSERKAPFTGNILISHTHWDHIQGIPFFAPLFVAGNEWHFYAAQGFGQSLQETLAGQMEYTYFPVTLDALNAQVCYHHLVEGSFQIGDVHVSTHYLNHPALTLGFRLEADGAVVVYACDHEPHSRHLAVQEGAIEGQDRGHAEFLRDADLVIHDAQYTAVEYPAKVGWGHSTVEYAVAVCREAGVKRLALTHHDPLRDDAAVDRMLLALRQHVGQRAPGLEFFAAAEGMEFDLHSEVSAAATLVEARPSALPPSRAEIERVVLIGSSADPSVNAALAAALRADGVRCELASDSAAVVSAYRQQRPGLVLVDESLAGASGVQVSHQIRAIDDGHALQVPIILVAQDPFCGVVPGPEVTEVLRKPFSIEYARTRIRAWLLRTNCRWLKPATAENEPQRLAALHALSLLDTPREPRFDRFTRLASALLDAPIALISLIDADRQWFKSCIGLDAQQTPREISFCAHAILRRDLLVIPDTLLDERFADNPVVVDGPRVRFYAGCPLFIADGSCVGTLCVADQRPRQLSMEQAQHLRDLGALVEQELGR